MLGNGLMHPGIRCYYTFILAKLCEVKCHCAAAYTD